jgi:hypothetical protein
MKKIILTVETDVNIGPKWLMTTLNELLTEKSKVQQVDLVELLQKCGLSITESREG